MKRNGKQRQVVVIGLGQFGSGLSRELARHCEVLAADMDQDIVDDIADKVQRALCLDARDFNSIKSVVSPEVDEAVVSMGDMEASILCTLHLHKIGVKSIRAKATSEDHATILRSVGAMEIIFPERDTAQRMARQIINPNLLDFIPIEKDYDVVDAAPPPSFIGKTLIELKVRKSFGVFVIAVRQPDLDKFLFLPGPDYVVRDKDTLVLIGKKDDLLSFGEEESKG